MTALPLLAAFALAGCTTLRVDAPGGLHVTATCLGQSSATVCLHGMMRRSADGAFVFRGPCAHAEGGPVSAALASLAAALASAAATAFASGAF